MNNSERTILIDMDGTIANFDETVTNALRINYPHIPIPERKSFYYEDDLEKEHGDAIQEIITRPEFFAQHSVIDGALEGWQDLQEQGYEPRICTAPIGGACLAKLHG